MNISINKKVLIYFNVTILTIIILLIGLVTYDQNRIITKEKEWMLQNVMNIAYEEVVSAYRDFEEGKITEDVAKNRAIEQIKRLRYGDGNEDYFWINDYTPVMVMHPFSTKLVGTNIGDIKDKKGVAIFIEAVKIVKAGGEGFMNYLWQYKSDANRVESKISHVRGFEKWQWVIGTGVYVNEIREEIIAVIVRVVIISLLLIAMAVLVIYFTLNKDLKNIGKVISQTSHSIKNSSNELSEGSQDLSSVVQEQSSSLEETAATMEEISATIKQTAENTEVANKTSLNALNVVVESEGISNMSMSSMENIEESSNKIFNIVALVEELAFQTNILAINAAIEAAKAGDTGKGFAVVAIEVRDLAQRSSIAALEIKDLISTTVTTIGHGVKYVTESSEKLKLVRESVQKIHDLVNEISISAKEQSKAVEEINQAISQIDTANQQNSGRVEEIAGLSEQLSIEAVQMDEVVVRYF